MKQEQLSVCNVVWVIRLPLKLSVDGRLTALCYQLGVRRADVDDVVEFTGADFCVWVRFD